VCEPTPNWSACIYTAYGFVRRDKTRKHHGTVFPCLPRVLRSVGVSTRRTLTPNEIFRRDFQEWPLFKTELSKISSARRHVDTVPAIFDVFSNPAILRSVNYVLGLSTHSLSQGRAQAFRRRLSTAATLVRSYFRSHGIFGGQGDIGVGFLRVLRPPLTVLISRTAPYPSIIRGKYNSPTSTKWTQSHPSPRDEEDSLSQILVLQRSTAPLTQFPTTSWFFQSLFFRNVI
jgi:hypothetical protein